MDVNMNAAVTFGELLQKNPRASAFYDRCTPEQRQAILLQLGQMNSQSQLGPLWTTCPARPCKTRTARPIPGRADFFYPQPPVKSGIQSVS